jgi:Uma2 family endonuclease
MATLAQIDVMQEGVLFGLPMPLTFRPPVAMSDEELMAFSRRNRPYRIERNAQGELEIMSPGGFDGGRREAFAGRMLGNWAEENGGVCASANTGFTLPDGAVRSPDASWISNDRVSRLTDEEKCGFAPVCPEFLIEILSETDSRRTLEEKMQMWIDNGAKLAWMIDPYAATVSIYRPGAAVELLERPESVEAGEPVAGFRLSTAMLWDIAPIK